MHVTISRGLSVNISCREWGSHVRGENHIKDTLRMQTAKMKQDKEACTRN